MTEMAMVGKAMARKGIVTGQMMIIDGKISIDGLERPLGC